MRLAWVCSGAGEQSQAFPHARYHTTHPIRSTAPHVAVTAVNLDAQSRQSVFDELLYCGVTLPPPPPSYWSLKETTMVCIQINAGVSFS